MRLTSTKSRLAVLAALSLAVMAATAGCTGSSSDAGDTKKSDMKIVIVSGPLTDPFFSAIKAGAEQAGKDLGVDVNYTAPADLKNLGPDLSRLEDAALSAKPDAVIGSIFFPDVQGPGFKKIADAGIPLTFINSAPDWEKIGGFSYVGEDPELFGSAAAQRFIDAGATKILCVNHAPGNPTLESRCKGLEDGAKAGNATSKVLNIPADQSNNPTAVTNAISGALRSDKDIDAVLTLGSGVAENAVRAIQSADSKAILGTGDLSKNVLNFVKSGKIVFAIDQQPYLQGYYGVLAATQKVKLGIQPVGQVRSAPLFVTKDDVDKVIKFNADNAGVRGAS